MRDNREFLHEGFKPCESLIVNVLQPVMSSSIQSLKLHKLHFANWSRAVGGAVQSLIVHQHGDSISGETQVQLHSSGPVPTGLKQEVTGGEESPTIY